MTTIVHITTVSSVTAGSMMLWSFLANEKRSQSLLRVQESNGSMPVLLLHQVLCIMVMISGTFMLSQYLDPLELFQTDSLTTPVLLGCSGLTMAAWLLGSTAANKHITKNFKGSMHGVPTSYFLVRIIFLINYEIWLRGMVFLVFVQEAGILLSLVINLAIYLLLHLHSNRNELFGCLVLGTVLCLITLLTGSILPAIIIHLSLALSFEWKISNRKNSLNQILRQ